MTDPANEAVSVMMSFGQSTIPIAKDLAELLLDAIETVIGKSGGGIKKYGGKAFQFGADHIDGLGHEGKVSLKELASSKEELMSIPVERMDLKTLEKQLKAYDVTFALMENPISGNFSIHAKAKDYARIEEALSCILVDIFKEQEASVEDQAQPQSEQAVETPSPEEVPEKQASEQVMQTEKKPDVDTRPATENQDRFIEALYEKGVISDDEYTEYQASPTVGSANRLLNQHRENAGFIDLGNQNKPNVELEPWSDERSVSVEVEGEDRSIEALLTTREMPGGFTLEAYDTGQAKVIDASGRTVWSAFTTRDMAVAQRLAMRGLDTHNNKESLRLNQNEPSTPGQKFDKKLDDAEKVAAKEALNAAKEHTTPHRVKENTRG